MKRLLAVKKAIPITVVEVTEKLLSSDDRPAGLWLCPGKSEAEPATWKVYNQLHASWISFKVGDFLNVGCANDIYPIDRDYFEKHYDLTGEEDQD